MFDLWTEETTYETWLSFPTLMNRSFIKDSKTVKLSPLDNAVRTIAAKNDDLIQLEAFINAALKEKLIIHIISMIYRDNWQVQWIRQ